MNYYIVNPQFDSMVTIIINLTNNLDKHIFNARI